MRPRKTDYGTIILHWLLVGATGVAFFSGLRIATEAPDRGWLDWLDALLPRANVWVPHMQAAVVLVTVSLAYAVYMIRSGLSRRIALDKVRLRGLVGRQQARLGVSPAAFIQFRPRDTLRGAVVPLIQTFHPPDIGSPGPANGTHLLG